MFRLKCLADSGALLVAVWLSLGSIGGVLAQDGKPYGLAKRERWENTRLVGTPEPPLPFTVEPVYKSQAWHAPIFIAPEPGSDRLFALLHESSGKPTELVTFRDEPKVAERTQLVELRGRIAYSFCFDPDYADNGQLYLFSNLRMDKFDGSKANRISRFVVQREPEGSVDPASEHVILEWRSGGHDGGGIAFGHDGMLYISTGDGTSDSDKWLSGQTLDDLLGSVLRIDIRDSTPEKPYVIPADNPFVDLPNARPELFAYGLRNPWRLTVDALTGQVWVGNNGQDLWETVHLVFTRGAIRFTSTASWGRIRLRCQRPSIRTRRRARSPEAWFTVARSGQVCAGTTFTATTKPAKSGGSSTTARRSCRIGNWPTPHSQSPGLRRRTPESCWSSIMPAAFTGLRRSRE
jgi:hypothetical protein